MNASCNTVPLQQPSPVNNTRRLWDIFCAVIDNHGDLGVCWRLTRQLLGQGQSVRLWVDDASALRWMAPDALELPHLQMMTWDAASQNHVLQTLAPAQVWVEAFGCNLPEAFVAHGAATLAHQPVWINLEYLSAEDWVGRMHRRPSPVMSGPAKGWTKFFFYPGFTEPTGGLLRETDLFERQESFDRKAWRQQHAPHLTPDGLLISLFCYEPAPLAQLLTQISQTPHHLLVTPGRPLAALKQALKSLSTPLRWSSLSYTDQNGFDDMLMACDLNFVRGEDSLVRALWAGQAFIWQIYPQEDNAHLAKLDAFLQLMKAPTSLRSAFHIWNSDHAEAMPAINKNVLTDWKACTLAIRQELLDQQDLLTQLMQHVEAIGNRH